MPVLPPTAASTMPAAWSARARRATPRSQVAATKPARSVVAPPPTATTASERVKPAAPSTAQQCGGDLGGLGGLPVGNVDPHRSRPASASTAAPPAPPASTMVGGWMHGDPLHPVAQQRRASGRGAGDRPAPRTGARPGPGRSGVESVTSPRSTIRSSDLVRRSGRRCRPSRSRPRRTAASARFSSWISRPRTLPSSSGRAVFRPDPLDGAPAPTLQPDHPVAGQCLPGGRRQHRAAAQGQHHRLGVEQLAVVASSSARKAGSPSSTKISAIGLPARSSITASASTELPAEPVGQ